MQVNKDLADASYNPNSLLDGLSKKLDAKNDAALSRMLEVGPPIISKVRHLRLPISASLLLRMHEVSGIKVKDLQAMMGDRRQKFRLSAAQGRPA